MNLSTNNEINSSAATSGSTGNSSGHTLPRTSHGTSRRTSTRSGNVTQKHSLCASSTSHGTTLVIRIGTSMNTDQSYVYIFE